MGKIFETIDIIGLFLAGGFFIFLSLLYSNKSLTFDMFAIGIIIILASVLGRPTFAWWLAHLYKENFSKGIKDYWAEVIKEINETDNKYDFNFNLRLPKTYMPVQKDLNEKLKIAIFEINREDLMLYNQEDWTFTGYGYPYITLIINTETLKIKKTVRGTLQDAYNYIDTHPEQFTDNRKNVLIPARTVETFYPQDGAIETETPQNNQPQTPRR